MTYPLSTRNVGGCQVSAFLVDLHFSVLFAPFPLFPRPGGYCLGAMCAAGLPVHMPNVSFFHFREDFSRE